MVDDHLHLYRSILNVSKVNHIKAMGAYS
jgi:hypothetical protein